MNDLQRIINRGIFFAELGRNHLADWILGHRVERLSRRSDIVSCCKSHEEAFNWKSVAEAIKDGRYQLWGDLLNVDQYNYFKAFDIGIYQGLFESEVFLCELQPV